MGNNQVSKKEVGSLGISGADAIPKSLAIHPTVEVTDERTGFRCLRKISPPRNYDIGTSASSSSLEDEVSNTCSLDIEEERVMMAPRATPPTSSLDDGLMPEGFKAFIDEVMDTMEDGEGRFISSPPRASRPLIRTGPKSIMPHSISDTQFPYYDSSSMQETRRPLEQADANPRVRAPRSDRLFAHVSRDIPVPQLELYPRITQPSTDGASKRTNLSSGPRPRSYSPDSELSDRGIQNPATVEDDWPRKDRHTAESLLRLCREEGRHRRTTRGSGRFGRWHHMLSTSLLR